MEDVLADVLRSWQKWLDEQVQSSCPKLTPVQRERQEAHAWWTTRWPRLQMPRSKQADKDILQVFQCTLAAMGALAPFLPRRTEQKRPHFTLWFPGITLLLAGAAIAALHLPEGLPFKRVCLSPFCVVEKREHYSLLTSELVHADANHLLSNLAFALPECLVLESQEGSCATAATVLELTALSGVLYVGWTVIERDALSKPEAYFRTGAVGMSSLAIALQVACRICLSERRTLVCFGATTPMKYIWVVSILLNHLPGPSDSRSSCPFPASFAGHMCGVLAGVLHGHVIAPALRALWRQLKLLGRRQGGRGRLPPQPADLGPVEEDVQPDAADVDAGGGGEQSAAGPVDEGPEGGGAQLAAGAADLASEGEVHAAQRWRSCVLHHVKELVVQGTLFAAVIRLVMKSSATTGDGKRRKQADKTTANTRAPT